MFGMQVASDEVETADVEMACDIATYVSLLQTNNVNFVSLR